MVVLYPLLRNSHPWPQGLTYALNARLDEVYNWIVDNQGSSWIYVYVLNPISNFLNWLVTQLTDLLNGMTWVGVSARCSSASACAGAAGARRWSCSRRSSRSACMGLWTESMQTLALMVASVSVALAIGHPARDLGRPQRRLQQGDHAGARRDADHPGVRVPDARRDPVLGRQPGRGDRDRDLRDAAGGAHHGARHPRRARELGRGRRLAGRDADAGAGQGAAAARAPDDHARPSTRRS